jgi:putative ABC transport system substrate-binding protein
MRRRDFVVVLASAAIPVLADAQQPARLQKIAFLSVRAATDREYLDTFIRALQELGYVEGRNIHIELRFAAGQNELLPRLAAELAGLMPDVIVAAGEPAIRAVRDTAGGIPIVMAVVGDPIGAGFAKSLARPGGNLTGFTNVATGLSAKRLDLLKEAVPNLRRVAVLRNPDNRRLDPVYWQECVTAARALAITLQPIMLASTGDPQSAFAAMTEQHAEALLLMPDPIFNSMPRRSQIVMLAERNRIAAIYDSRDFVDFGGLMSYGPYLPDMYRQAGVYVDKILRGAKPQDLPIEEPTKFEFVINLKAAKGFGLNLPQALIVRADEVIE